MNRTNRIYDTKQLPVYLTSREIAQLLGVSSDYATKLMRDGDLPCVKFGKLYRASRDTVLARLQEMEAFQ
ncbi:MAG: helix-turn-helix domain-containing protein [Oscillospiraceae bacterium]